MGRLVRVRGESSYEHVLDLEKNPWAEEQIRKGSLEILEELDELPPDPWAEPVKKAAKKTEGDALLAALKKADLVAKAEELGVEIDPSATKAEIVAAIEAKVAEVADSSEDTQSTEGESEDPAGGEA